MKSLQFIIVDDDAINNRLCQLGIARHFGSVPTKSYQDPSLALQSISDDYNTDQYNPTVLLLDIKMPRLNGWQFLERFAALPENLQRQFLIYVVSATTDQENIDMAKSHPLVSGFLSKPLTDAKMERAFRALPDEYGVRCFS
jgi:two-component system, chemotaxis family, chemotaxis protein CheY